jgi:plastocyanin
MVLVALALPGGVGAADEVVIIGQRLRPAELAIEPGTTVTWQNRHDERHRVRSEDGPERLDSKNLDPGESWSHTFTLPGTYPYYDHRARDAAAYFGTIVVSGGEAVGEDAVALDTAAISVIDDAYSPAETSVVGGGTVEWTNRGADEHTVTANDLSFDSGELVSGASFSMTFEAAGEYGYFCTIHPEMRGTISVVDAGGTPVGRAGAGDDAPPVEASPAANDAATDSTDFGAPSLGSALDALATPLPE